MSASYQPFQNAPAAAEACAGHIVTVLESALACQELATLAVSGGTSPRGMFERLGAADLPSNRTPRLLGPGLACQERATRAVSGGTSPRWMFERLGASALPWNRTHLFFVDERVVPPSDPASNFKLANEHLILPARVPQSSVHRAEGELDPQAAAQRYADDIRRFRSQAHTSELPSLRQLV